MTTKGTPYSGLKIFRHPEKLNAIRNGERTAPIYMRIKPTNICNHDCYYCSYKYSNNVYHNRTVIESDQIPWDIMQRMILDMGNMGVKAVTFSGGGEPLMYPKITDAVRLMSQNGIEISLITNGHLLKGVIGDAFKEAKWIRISLDSVNVSMYAKIRGIANEALMEVCDNIKKFACIKEKNCELGINFVINEENHLEIYEVAQLMKLLGVNHVKFAARITLNTNKYHEKFKHKAIELIHKAIDDFTSENFGIINVYEDDFEHATLNERQYERCYIKDIFTVIAADCKVYHCHDKAYNDKGIVGDLKKKSFKELWFDEEIISIAKEFDPREECRHHCVYDNRNILLNNFMTLNENHINFI